MSKHYRYVLAALAIVPLYAQNNDRAIAQMRAYLNANRAQIGIADPDRDLTVRSASRDARGNTHIRLDQSFRGVPVFEGQAIAHVDRTGNVKLTNSLRGNLSLGVLPSITGIAAMRTVEGAMGLGVQHQDSSSELTILPQGARSTVDVLTWHVHIFDELTDGPVSVEAFVNAASGAIVWSYNSLETAETTGLGKSMYLGDENMPVDLLSGVYYLRAPSFSNYETRDAKNRFFGQGQIFTNGTGVFGNNQRDSSDRATAGADAHLGVLATLSYYAAMHNRNGIDGNGRSTYSRVHYRRNYNNAFWNDSCFCMTFGDGNGSYFLPLVALDITGHELSHGVMATEAALTYSGESGGLNESNSDIFGTLVEFFENNDDDTPEYWIGERAFASNWSSGSYIETTALRYMDHPSNDGTSPNCWSPTLGNLDVHYSSGPNNHMFYLLAHGGTSACNSDVVTGIGNDKAGLIWYEAISNYMTSSTDYHGARTAALEAADTLYGNTSPEYAAVGAAFSAINVD